eukprot:15343519-Ditylum_brightwellii.AAC.1
MKLISLNYADKVLHRNKHIADLVTSTAIDHVHLDKVSVEVRDVLFSKLDSYAQIFVAMGALDEEVGGFGDIPPECVYTMDEIGIHTFKRTKLRVVCMATISKKGVKVERKSKDVKYRRTCEGDSNIKCHVSYVICSRSDGKYSIPGKEEEGTIPPFIAHKQISKKRD